MAIKSFRRIEKKFIINEYQKEELLKEVHKHMDLDSYCLNDATYHIQNIYLDTENNTLISHSIRKPSYKEKLRLRKYTGMKKVFFEIKKKINGVVGKRRVCLSMEDVDALLNNKEIEKKESAIDNQIITEIQYVLKNYKCMPKVYISYDRLGFFDKNDPEFRLTIDDHIYSNREVLEFDQPTPGPYLLNDGLYLMEIKSCRNFPLWLVRKLTELNIHSNTFSKYGTEYKKYLREQEAVNL